MVQLANVARGIAETHRRNTAAATGEIVLPGGRSDPPRIRDYGRQRRTPNLGAFTAALSVFGISGAALITAARLGFYSVFGVGLAEVGIDVPELLMTAALAGFIVLWAVGLLRILARFVYSDNWGLQYPLALFVLAVAIPVGTSYAGGTETLGPLAVALLQASISVITLAFVLAFSSRLLLRLWVQEKKSPYELRQLAMAGIAAFSGELVIQWTTWKITVGVGLLALLLMTWGFLLIKTYDDWATVPRSAVAKVPGETAEPLPRQAAVLMVFIMFLAPVPWAFLRDQEIVESPSPGSWGGILVVGIVLLVFVVAQTYQPGLKNWMKVLRGEFRFLVVPVGVIVFVAAAFSLFSFGQSVAQVEKSYGMSGSEAGTGEEPSPALRQIVGLSGREVCLYRIDESAEGTALTGSSVRLLPSARHVLLTWDRDSGTRRWSPGGIVIKDVEAVSAGSSRTLPC